MANAPLVTFWRSRQNPQNVFFCVAPALPSIFAAKHERKDLFWRRRIVGALIAIQHSRYTRPQALFIINPSAKMSKTKVDVKKARQSAKKHNMRNKAWVPPPNVHVPNIKDGCNTGRWTKEESLLFLHALKVMGTGQGMWRKIGLFVPTR